MYKIFVIVILLTANALLANAQLIQTADKAEITYQSKLKLATLKKASSITFHLNKMAGIGPSGFNSIETGTTDSYKNSTEQELKDEYKAYPVMKNKPANLTDVIEYLFMLDRPQFYYQNYIAGIYTKSFLLSRFKELRFNPDDTLKLSRKPLKCYISVLGGVNADKEPYYIVDANNNGDYADDTVRPVLKNVHDENLTVSSSVPVTISYLYNNEVKEDTKPIFIQRSNNPQKFTLQISFPEFSYLRFAYKGQPYMICVDNNGYWPFCNVLPDRPYFTNIPRSKALTIGQIVQIGDDYFKLSDITNNGKDVVLTGADISGFGTNKPSITKPDTKNINKLVSRQIGFTAPTIKGINMNPGSILGAPINTMDMKGKYVLIDIWSTYCGPCIEQFEYLKEVYSKYSRKDLEIIGVIDDRNTNTTLQLLSQHHILWPNVKTEAKTTLMKGYEDIASYPTTYLLDRTGKIIATELRGNDLMNRLKVLLAVK